MKASIEVVTSTMSLAMSGNGVSNGKRVVTMAAMPMPMSDEDVNIGSAYG